MMKIESSRQVWTEQTNGRTEIVTSNPLLMKKEGGTGGQADAELQGSALSYKSVFTFIQRIILSYFRCALLMCTIDKSNSTTISITKKYYPVWNDSWFYISISLTSFETCWRVNMKLKKTPGPALSPSGRPAPAQWCPVWCVSRV